MGSRPRTIMLPRFSIQINEKSPHVLENIFACSDKRNVKKGVLGAVTSLRFGYKRFSNRFLFYPLFHWSVPGVLLATENYACEICDVYRRNPVSTHWDVLYEAHTDRPNKRGCRATAQRVE